MKQKISKKEPKGLGGWLVLFQIGIILSAILLARAIFNLLDSLDITFNIFSLLLNIILLIFDIYVIILMYKKSRKFPKTTIITLWVSVAIYSFSLIPAYLSKEVDISLRQYVVISMIANTFFQAAKAIIWTIYLKKSRRVKNTFVN